MTRIFLIAAMFGLPTAALAQIDTAGLIAGYQAEGYTSIEVTRGVNQTKVEAVRDTFKVEAVYDNDTGATLKSETGTVGAGDDMRDGVRVRDRNEDFVSGGSDDSNDDNSTSGDDDGEDHTSGHGTGQDGDEGGDDNGGNGGNGGGDDNGGDDHGGQGGDDHGGNGDNGGGDNGGNGGGDNGGDGGNGGGDNGGDGGNGGGDNGGDD